MDGCKKMTLQTSSLNGDGS
jgi:PA domain